MVASIHEYTSLAYSIIITDFRGISVNTITKLRKAALKSDVKINIVKNTLLKKALENTAFSFFSKKIKGPTLKAFSLKHPGSAAKLFKKFEKDNIHFKINLAAFENKILSNIEIEKLALMPTYNEAIIKIIRILKEITVGKLIRILLSIKNTKNH